MKLAILRSTVSKLYRTNYVKRLQQAGMELILSIKMKN